MEKKYEEVHLSDYLAAVMEPLELFIELLIETQHDNNEAEKIARVADTLMVGMKEKIQEMLKVFESRLGELYIIVSCFDWYRIQAEEILGVSFKAGHFIEEYIKTNNQNGINVQISKEKNALKLSKQPEISVKSPQGEVEKKSPISLSHRDTGLEETGADWPQAESSVAH